MKPIKAVYPKHSFGIIRQRYLYSQEQALTRMIRKEHNPMKPYTYPSVLSIAGFDPMGAAGLQADLKTISALGCYALSVLSALPIQNTRQVDSIFPIPAAVVAQQLRCILADHQPDAIKIGLLQQADTIEILSQILREYPQIPLIIDPVFAATSGQQFVADSVIQRMRDQLFPLATLLTPNLDEASILIQKKIQTVQQMHHAAAELLKICPQGVLLKGGHLKQDTLTSILFSPGAAPVAYSAPKISSSNTRGTGCSLASAIASYIALGEPVEAATKLAQDYVYAAILAGQDIQLGTGNGPLNHFFCPQKLIKKAV